MNQFFVIKTLPQMYCKVCGLPATQGRPVPVKDSFCDHSEWVIEESDITWDSIRNRSGSGEIMAKTLEEVRKKGNKS